MARLTVNIDMNVEEASVNELYLLEGMLKIIGEGYERDGIDTPEIIVDKMGEARREIVNRNRAELQRKLKLARAKRGTMASREERIAAVDAEITKLEQQLG